MKNFLLGLVIGIAVCGVMLVLLSIAQSAGSEANRKIIAGQKVDLARQAEKINSLEMEKKGAETRLEEATVEKEQLNAKVDQLQQELEQANDREALLQAQIEKLTAPAAEKLEQPEEAAPAAEDELLKAQREAIEKYSLILKVGQPLSDEARKELEVDDTAEARINELLKDEAARSTKALAQFCRENIADPPQDLSEWTAQALIGRIAPEMMKNMSQLSQLTQEDHLKLARGEKDLLDYLPRDSQVMRLAYALYKVRQETYRQVERELPPEKMDTFKEKYLPPNDFLFPGNLNMAFGKIDWEKER